MTQHDLLTFNKMCAEFIGAEKVHRFDSLGFNYYKHSLFHRREWSNRFQDYEANDLMCPMQMEFYSDWNWLMTIIDSIQIKCKVFININGNSTCEIKCAYPSGSIQHRKDLKFDCYADTKKESVIETLNQFLIWYNETTTTNTDTEG